MEGISVIIGTYNSLPAMELCLASLERQSFRDFEVVVADDGSGQAMVEWLKNYRSSFPITHVWHEDRGFRKCRILNRAIQQTRGQYLVFLDADCIVSKDFLHVHWKNREKDAFLGGRRIMIKEEFAPCIQKRWITEGRFDGFNLWGLYQSVVRNFKYYEETVTPLHFFKKKKYLDFVGSNFSVFKSSLYRINGFDEDYEHRGGGEDTDIAWRLHMAGVRFKSVRCLAVQFHIGHKSGEKKVSSEKMFLEKKEKIRNAQDARNIHSSLAEKEQHDFRVVRRDEKEKNYFS